MTLAAIFTALDSLSDFQVFLILAGACLVPIAHEIVVGLLEHFRWTRRQRRHTDLHSLGHTKLGTTKTTQRRGGDRR